MPYFRDHWCQFDASMVLFLWTSVILQICQLFEVVSQFSYLTVLRAPRPLIMIRFLRVFLKFSMPKSRINQIFKYVTFPTTNASSTGLTNFNVYLFFRRSSQQIYNVTLFFIFFMSLYGLLGVQFFGELKNHCVMNTTNVE